MAYQRMIVVQEAWAENGFQRMSQINALTRVQYLFLPNWWPVIRVFLPPPAALIFEVINANIRQMNALEIRLFSRRPRGSYSRQDEGITGKIGTSGSLQVPTNCPWVYEDAEWQTPGTHNQRNSEKVLMTAILQIVIRVPVEHITLKLKRCYCWFTRELWIEACLLMFAVFLIRWKQNHSAGKV